AKIPVSGRGIENVPPTVKLISPVGGEVIISGTSFNVQFSGSDNDQLTGFKVSYSTDGGTSFPFNIGFVGPDATQIVWNVPDELETTKARIQVTARDRSGKKPSATSCTLTVQKRPKHTAHPMLEVATRHPP